MYKMFYKVVVSLIFAVANCQELTIDSRIINGEDADITTIPYQVMLTYDEKFICGAVLISPNHVLTAAHCLYQGNFLDKRKLRMFTGVTKKSRRYQDGQIYNVQKFIIHWLFYVTQFNGDIAIIVPSTPIHTDGVYVKPIELATGYFRPGCTAQASGWGRSDDEGTLPDILQVAQIKTRPCYWFVDSICARGESGVCQGDSGGPLVYNNKLIGIARAKISESGKCTAQSEIYTSVYYYKDFINRIVQLW